MKAANPDQLGSGAVASADSGFPHAAEIISRERWTPRRTAKGLFKSSSILGAHHVVENRVNRCAKIVKAASQRVEPLVYLRIIGSVPCVDVEQTLGVKRRPADEEHHHNRTSWSKIYFSLSQKGSSLANIERIKLLIKEGIGRMEITPNSHFYNTTIFQGSCCYICIISNE